MKQDILLLYASRRDASYRLYPYDARGVQFGRIENIGSGY